MIKEKYKSLESFKETIKPIRTLKSNEGHIYYRKFCV